MKKRSPVAVVLLSLITFGFYSIYWLVKTKTELNAHGAQIPTAWFIIIPFVNIWWYWKYSEGVHKVTNGNPTDVLTFVLLLLLSCVGQAILQHYFNNNNPAAPVAVSNTAAPASTPPAPITPVADKPAETPPEPPKTPAAPVV